MTIVFIYWQNFQLMNVRKALISGSLILLIVATPILNVPPISIRSADAQPSGNGEEQPLTMNVSRPVTPKVLEGNLSSLRLPEAPQWSPGDPIVEAPGQQLESQFVPEEGEDDQPPPTRSGSNDTNGNQTLTNPNTLNSDLRGIAPEAPWSPGDPIVEAPGQQLEGPSQPLQQNTTVTLNNTGGVANQTSLSSAISDPISAPLVNFEGIPATGFVPPDTVGDVGPNHYIQAVNVQFAIYDKAGTLLVGPSNINSLWVAASTNDACQFNNHGDPVVQYDHLADRWLISQFAIPGPDVHECIAISRTADPVTGGWFLYDFTMSAFPDYPKIGVWPDAYYMGTNAGYPTGHAWAFDRANMLNGNPASVIGFFGFGTFMLPSDLEGPSPPPGTPNTFLRFVDGTEFGGADRLEMREFHVDFANPALSSFTALPDLLTAPFDSNLCGFFFRVPCIPQPGTSQLLDVLRGEPMYRLQYRNFGTHESLLVNHDIDVNGADLAGIRWYELRKVGGGPWSIFQQGDYSPDGTHRWMGSIAMDKNGNMALGYSISSTTTFPSIKYTGREPSEPLGTMPQGEFTIVDGGGSQSFSERWGDYSSMNVDPTDDCTFWYTTMYFPTSANWQTQIASFKFTNCNVEPPDCNNPTIVGSENRNDILQGTLGSDVIAGLSGNDIINGNSGDDEICGGSGNDIINADVGDDRVNGDAGNDLINAGAGNDQLYGRESNDIINAGAGNDLVDGGQDNDVGNGGSGQDQCSNVEIVSGCEI
jgi:hypothetical protein